jgi:hypothetical protein
MILVSLFERYAALEIEPKRCTVERMLDVMNGKGIAGEQGADIALTK